MTGMTSYRAGEILLVEYPFVGGGQSKFRPALVLLDTGDLDILMARMTSRQHVTPYEVSVVDWRGAGLHGPAHVRLHKMVTLPKSDIVRRIGALQQPDHQRVSSLLLQLFGNW